MDSESTPTTGGERAKTSEEEFKGTSLTTVLGSIAQISGVVTVVAGTIYALGMITLLLPIYNAYDTTFSAAWYMVSLIPKTTVAGYGAKSLLWPSLATVLPIAFITVMILTVFSLLWVAVRHAARHARAAQGDMIRGVLFIVAVYAGYSVLLGAVNVTLLFLGNLFFGRVVSEGTYAILRYHIVAELLAYSILAMLSALALLLLALRAATFIANLATAKAFSYASFLTLGSLRVSLYLALCVGMACVVASGVKLLSLGFFGADLFDPQAELSPKPLASVWGDILSTLIVVLPMVLLLLLVDRAIPLMLLNHCGPRLRAVGYTCRIFSVVTVIGTALLGILYFFFAFQVYGQFVRSRATLILETVFNTAGFLTILLCSGLLMIWLLGKVIPPTVRGMSRDKLRMLLATAVVGGVILAFANYIVVSLVANTGFRKAQWTWADLTLLILAGVLSAVAVLVLLLRAGLYLVRLLVSGNVAPAQNRSSLVGKVHDLKSSVSARSMGMLRFAGTFFILFYLVLAVVFLYAWYVIHPLYSNINSISSSQSGLDELFVRLSIIGGILSGLLLYFKGFLSHTKDDLFLVERWRSFPRSLRRAVLPSSIKRGFVWSLGGAYVFSLIVASLIAFLEPPPLPLVEMSVKESSSTQKLLSSGSEALGSQPEAKRLLAHTEGHWYLFDEREKRLLVVPDSDDYVVWFPQYVEIVNSSEAFKLEVPVTWDERDDVRDEGGKTDNNPSGYDYADLTVSTNVDNWSEQYGVEAGVNIRARRGSWSTDEVDRQLDKLKNKTLKGTGCKYVDRWHHEVHDKDGVLEGKVARWTDCGGEDNTIVAVVVLPEDGNFKVTLEIDMPKGGEQEHVDHVLNNFWVDGTRLPSS